MSKKSEKGDKKKEETQEQGAEDLTLLLKHVQADFENYKKRVEREKQDLIKSASKQAILKLLPVLDNFDLALSNADPKEEFVKGVQMIRNQLLSALEQEGLKPFSALNTPFDPRLHEALMQEESEKKEGLVIEEFQKGYLLNDKVVRHAKVKVSAGASSTKTEE